MKTLFSTTKSILMAIALLAVSGMSAQQPTVVVDKVNKTFGNITTIEVEGSFCSAVVTTGTSDDVTFSGEIKAPAQRDDIKIKYADANNTLKVWIERPGSLSGNFDGKLYFTVPANTNVYISNSSGNINVSGIGNANVVLKASSGSITAASISSDLTCQTSSGSQTISGIKGNFKSASSSGSQRIKDIGGFVETSASSGSLNIDGVGMYTSAETSSGSLRVSAVKGNVKAKATSGSVHVSNVTGDVVASSSSGSINLNQIKGALSTQSSSGSQSGNQIILTGNSSFASSSGSISMGLTNDASQLSFELKASSGSLNAKGVKGSKNLIVDKGPIKITGNSSSGSQSYN
ncbi:MAG: hypothetical protein QM786_18820 [Breznakibacter sp.]